MPTQLETQTDVEENLSEKPDASLKIILAVLESKRVPGRKVMERVAALNEARDAGRRLPPTSRSALCARGGRGHPRECGRLGDLGGRRFDRPQRDRSPPEETGLAAVSAAVYAPRFVCSGAHGELRRDLDPSSGLSTLSPRTCHQGRAVRVLRPLRAGQQLIRYGSLWQPTGAHPLLLPRETTAARRVIRSRTDSVRG